MAAWRCVAAACAGAALLALVPHSEAAIQPANVLVLYNSDSPDGAQIANYYSQDNRAKLKPNICRAGS